MTLSDIKLRTSKEWFIRFIKNIVATSSYAIIPQMVYRLCGGYVLNSPQRTPCLTKGQTIQNPEVLLVEPIYFYVQHNPTKGLASMCKTRHGQKEVRVRADN